MCGIWIYIQKNTKITDSSVNISKLYEYFFKINSRGPERSKFITLNDIGIMLGFHRLCIMDLSPEYDQPYFIEKNGHNIYTLCNGEIYNYEFLKKKYNITTKTDNDCEILQYIYAEVGIKGLADELISNEISGEYAIVIVDIYNNDIKIHMLRDPTGIRPLFISENNDSICITSEMKGSPHLLEKNEYSIKHVQPRIIMTMGKYGNNITWTYEKYFEIKSSVQKLITCPEIAKNEIKNGLIHAVNTRMHADRDLAFLLSGGVDSSLVCAIAAEYAKKNNKKIKTYSIGLPNGTDKKYAELVSRHIGSEHLHIEMTENDFINAIEDIVIVCETYDITTIRASTGQYLISKYIRENTDSKVLYIGDGSDELFGSYLYFHKAPTPLDAHNESVRLLNDIHMFDVLRADRGIASNGLEARIPFLDHRLITTVMNIDPSLRVPINGIEKWILRESFKDTNLLPFEILYRKKEAFSDGVSSVNKSWYMILQEHIDKLYTDEELLSYQQNCDHCVPKTKEALHYRKLYELHFGNNSYKVVPYFWLPKWCGNIEEPSARILHI